MFQTDAQITTIFKHVSIFITPATTIHFQTALAFGIDTKTACFWQQADEESFVTFGAITNYVDNKGF